MRSEFNDLTCFNVSREKPKILSDWFVRCERNTPTASSKYFIQTELNSTNFTYFRLGEKQMPVHTNNAHTHSYTLAWLAVSVLDCLWAVCMRRANNVNEWQSAEKRQTETRNAFLSSLADMCGCLLFSLLLLLFWCFFHLLYFNALFCSYMIHCACVFFWSNIYRYVRISKSLVQ